MNGTPFGSAARGSEKRRPMAAAARRALEMR
jgi:hypothetical protein